MLTRCSMAAVVVVLGITPVVLATAIGATLASPAGFAGVRHMAIMRMTDVFYAFPSYCSRSPSRRAGAGVFMRSCR